MKVGLDFEKVTICGWENHIKTDLRELDCEE